MSESHPTLADVRQAALGTVMPPKRGRPPKVQAPEPESAAPAGDDGWSWLAARARERAQRAEAADAKVREDLAVYGDRARACESRLRAWSPQIAAALQHAAVDLGAAEVRLGAETALIPHIRAVRARLESVCQPRADTAGLVRSTLETIAAIPTKIAALTAKDRHACSPHPPRCRCPIETIKTEVEDAEVVASRVPVDLAALAELGERLKAAELRRGGGVEVVTLPTTLKSDGLTITTSTGAPDGDEGA